MKLPHLKRLVALMTLLFWVSSGAFAGTGGPDEPLGSKKDDDRALRAAVRWITRLKGVEVKQTERTMDYNVYYIDQSKASKGLLEKISRGLARRKWSVKSNKKSKTKDTLRVARGSKELQVTVHRRGAEPRLIVEIVKKPKKK